MENRKVCIRNLLVSIIFSLILSVVSVFLLSIISYTFVISQNYVDICIYTILVLTFFSAGFIIGNKQKHKVIIWGLTVGIILILLFIIMGLLFFSLNTVSFKKLFFLLLISVIGSILGVNINVKYGGKKRRVKFKINKNK